MIELEDVKNWSATAFYIILIVCTIVFTVSYAFVDWEGVSGDFNEAMNDLSKSIDCKIDFKDLHYDGFCVNTEEVFDFLKFQYNTTIYTTKPTPINIRL